MQENKWENYSNELTNSLRDKPRILEEIRQQ